jgi:hypothetical protein
VGDHIFASARAHVAVHYRGGGKKPTYEPTHRAPEWHKLAQSVIRLPNDPENVSSQRVSKTPTFFIGRCLHSLNGVKTSIFFYGELCFAEVAKTDQATEVKPKHCQIDFLHGALGPKTTTFL